MHRKILVLFIVLFSGVVMAIEEPKYSVIEQSGDIELRIYAPIVIAETIVDGDMNTASSAGFKLIADYIFGNNTAQSGHSEKVSMTAPVGIEPNAKKIQMTAPVTMEENNGQWRVYFVMPSQYTMATLPKPNNPKVNLRAIPEKHYAVIRFSGLAGEAKVAKKTSTLLAWLDKNQLTPMSTPALARYNPPWTLPFLRRNEVMVEYQ